jgi:hypothetical protein
MLNNVPLSGQFLGTSRPLIAQNFSVIDTAFSVDHVDYNTPSQGKHEKVTLVSNPAPGFLAGEIGLFNQTAAPTAIPDLWLQRGTAAPFPMTGYTNVGTNGWTYLPSGLLCIWGFDTIPTSSSLPRAIVFNSAVPSFPGFTTFVGFIGLTRYLSGTPANTTNFGIVQAYTTAGFSYYGSTLSTNISFMWYAIGL